ncbi:hypothetical protein ACHAWU_008974 [Discostella pseudostelligera]|uniref:Uncharacterized protein n=1 Tax=Discostella pseudostelligera TaxID=259834 RepID=A0ABD3MKB7_9STRA
MSFVQDLLKPGGGIALIPFIRATIVVLLLMVIIMGIFDIARIHMIVLACLSTGLLISISMFEKAWNDVQRSRGGSGQTMSQKEPNKTD